MSRPKVSPTRRLGRPRDNDAARARKRDQLRMLVIRFAADGWRRWPTTGPSRKFIADRLYVTESGLRKALARSGLDFDELSSIAFDRVFVPFLSRIGAEDGRRASAH